MSRRLLAYLLLIVPAAFAAEPQKLTLPDAVRMALAQNRSLKIARLKVAENEQKKAANRADYFPELKNQSMIAHTTAVEDIGIPAGAFGTIPGGGLSPDRNVLITQGNQTFFTSGTSLTQPLTPLIRIHAANRIAAAETAASRDDLKAAENEVALQVHQVYYNILTTRLRKLAAEQESAYSETRLSESQQDIRNGNALKVAAIEGRAGLLQSLQDSLTLDLQLSDLNYELNDLLALPLDTRLELSPVEPVALPGPSREEALSAALAENPQIAAAQEKVEQAKAGVAAAKSAYIPERLGICPAELSERRSVPGPQLRHVRRLPQLRFVRLRQAPRRGARARSGVGASRTERREAEGLHERADRTQPQQGGADGTNVAGGRRSRQAARRGRTGHAESVDRGRGPGVGAAAGFRGQLQGAGRSPAGATGAPVRAGGTRADHRPDSRAIGFQVAGQFGPPPDDSPVAR